MGAKWLNLQIKSFETEFANAKCPWPRDVVKGILNYFTNFMLERPHRGNQVNKVFRIFRWHQGKRPQWGSEGNLDGGLAK